MLKRHPTFPGVAGPVVLVVMDGVGYREGEVGNAARAANTPTLDRLWNERPRALLKAHGTAVGMPSDADMGNSEVGHNAMGSGQVFAQGASLVSDAIQSGSIYEGETWCTLVSHTKTTGGTLHLLGLVSDGNVHSHVDHLRALVARAKDDGVARVRVHALLDGRDVAETSALEYIEPLEALLEELSDDQFAARIASGGGRMAITMDRYEANWAMVERGWHTHVLGEGPRFASAAEAIRTLREEHPGTIDQDLPPFVIADGDAPAGTIEDGDAVVFFNFRGDRAIEISRAFEEDKFDAFDRVRRPDVCFAGMLEYDGDKHIPSRYLVAPPVIEHTMGEYLSEAGVSQLAVSETQKFGHVTYFWNGNRSGAFNDDFETYVEVTSDIIPFDQAPRMKADEITDVVIEALRSGEYRHIRANLANGDMVGHTGDFDATVLAMEAVDECIARLLPEVDKAGGVLVVTADHGNAEEMYELDKQGEPKRNEDGSYKSRTSHTLNPVPLLYYDNQTNGAVTVKPDTEFQLANLTSTIVNLLGYEEPSMWEPGVLAFS